MTKEALTLALEALERLDGWLALRYGSGLTPQEKQTVTAIKEALAQPEQEKERCVGCEACIDTACGRDECPKGWPKAAQPEQEPVAWYHPENDRTYFTAYPDKNLIENGYWQPLYKKGKL